MFTAVNTSTETLERLDPADARAFHHVPGLDGVRGVAVLLVIVFHYGALWQNVRTGGLLPGGYIGVDVFFVLSGFLITSLLVGEQAKVGKVSLPRFYARRALRLFPALAFILVAHVVFTMWTRDSLVEEAKQVAAVVFYVSNLAQTYFLRSMAHGSLSFTWSLAIEEQFYLLWPALLLFGVLRFARTRAMVLTLIGGAALLSAAIRFVLWVGMHAYAASYFRPDARADGLLIGAFCAFAWRWGLVPRRYLNEAALAAAALILGVALLAGRPDHGMFQGGFTAVSVAVGVIILAVAENKTVLLPLLEWAPLRLVGKLSYGLYLWHVLGLRIARHAFDGSGRLPLTLIGLAITVVAVTVSWNVVEQPFLRLKTRVASPVAH
jgi:peptidoglycan/LPS O-acetylase OafA/YrhL